MKTLLGISINKIDKSKYLRQLRCVVKWVKGKARGTVVAATGVGKTFIAFIAIVKMKKRHLNATTIIIVPTTVLKDQWEKQIESLKLKNVTVYVINSVALNTLKYDCDLLVLDEIHMMASEQFSKVFQLVKYKWILGLTATIERLDGKHVLLQKYAPVVDTITQKEAVLKGWISDFIEINVPVNLSRKEIEGLENLDKQIRYYMSKFGDFDIMRNCMIFEKAKAFAQLHYPHQDTNSTASEIVKWAVQGQRHIKKRQEFLYNTERKVEVAVELVNEFGLKTIMFSQSTQFADTVSEKLGDKAVTYHSNIKSQTRLLVKEKIFKKQDSAENFKKLKEKAKIEKIPEGYKVIWKEPKVFGLKVLKEEAIKLFKDNRTNVSVISTAKALDQGFDVADTELGIDGSRTSNPTQHTQRTGRIARNYTYKDGTKKRGVYINLYVPNSRDEGWLRACQKNNPERVIWANNVEECKTTLKNML